MTGLQKIWFGIKTTCKSLFGLLLSPLDALLGLWKEIYGLGSEKGEFTNGFLPGHKDPIASITPFIATVGRIFTLTVFAICVAGFIGTLVIPLPGMAPLYLATLVGAAKGLAIAKAFFITSACSLGGRTLGAFAGAGLDYLWRMKNLTTPTSGTGINLGSVALRYGLFGEFALGFKLVIDKIFKKARVSGIELTPRNRIEHDDDDTSTYKKLQRELQTSRNKTDSAHSTDSQFGYAARRNNRIRYEPTIDSDEVLALLQPTTPLLSPSSPADTQAGEQSSPGDPQSKSNNTFQPHR